MSDLPHDRKIASRPTATDLGDSKVPEGNGRIPPLFWAPPGSDHPWFDAGQTGAM